MMLNLLLHLMLAKLALLVFSYKKAPLVLYDLVLIGLENLKIVKHDIVLMTVKPLLLLRLCSVYGECIYLDVNTSQ